MSDITQILSAIDAGNPHAAEQLLPLVYDELRKLAAQKLAQEKPGQTLQATALVHEAYVRLVGHLAPGESPGASFANRGHFFAAAAEAMRRILIDNARHKRRPKHGGGLVRVSMDEAFCLGQASDDDLLALDEALERLAREEPAKAELVKLHFYAGLALEEAGQVLGISYRTAKRHWAYARAWLYATITDDPQSSGD